MTRIVLILLCALASVSQAFSLFGSGSSDSTLPTAALIAFPLPSVTSDPQTSDITLDISDRLFREAYKAGKWRLIERDRVQSILQEQALGQATEQDMGRGVFPTVGRLLGAQRLLIPTLNRVEGISLLSLREVDVETGEVLFMAEAETDQTLESSYKQLAYLVVGRLAGNPDVPPSDSGYLQVISSPPTDIWVDGKPVGRTPVTLAVWPGTHAVGIVPTTVPAFTPERRPEEPDLHLEPVFHSGWEGNYGAPSRWQGGDPAPRKSSLGKSGYGMTMGKRALAQKERATQRAETKQNAEADDGDDDAGAAAVVIVVGAVVAVAGVAMVAVAATMPDSLWKDTLTTAKVTPSDTTKVEFIKQSNDDKTTLMGLGILGTILGVIVLTIGLNMRD